MSAVHIVLQYNFKTVSVSSQRCGESHLSTEKLRFEFMQAVVYFLKKRKCQEDFCFDISATTLFREEK